MEVIVLGPVRLQGADGGIVPVGGPRRRAVLALLAVHMGQVVTAEQFFEMLWDDAPPPQARAALQGHVAALRKLLAGGPLELLTRPTGYLLTGPTDACDLTRFDALLADAAEQDDAAEAADSLRAAVGLWHGAALGDLPDSEMRDSLAESLERRRTAAVEAWAEQALLAGETEEVTPLLEAVVAEDGLRESATALLMRCLAGAGRRDDALSRYETAKERLAAELGVDPGRRLTAAFDAIRQDPGTGTGAGPAPAPTATPSNVPRMLPRVARGFVRREAERDQLEHLRLHDPSRIAVVVGPGGVGKSELALTYAHKVAADFPDGQLFADLRGFDPGGGVDPSSVLHRFLDALGVPSGSVPATSAERAELFRSLTTGQVLVVLDNAARPEDVRPLLPGGASCLTLVTSRNVMQGLAVSENAALVPLDVLPPADAVELVDSVIGCARAAQEPDAVRQLVELCDRLPLALRIAAARLAVHPTWSVAELVEQLGEEKTRLSALDAAAGLGVVSTLESTRRVLTPEAERLLALLALHPGVEADGHVSAALLDTGQQQGRATLDQLASHHLVSERAPGRYARHDLVRLYSREVLDGLLPRDEQAAAVRRLLDHYLVATHAAQAHRTSSRRLHLPDVTPVGGTPAMPSTAQALRWFGREEPAVRGLVEGAAEWGLLTTGCALLENSAALYYESGLLREWEGACAKLLGLLPEPGDWPLLFSDHGVALYGLGRLDDAVRAAERAYVLAEHVSDPAVRHRTRSRLATIKAQASSYEECLPLLQATLEAAKEVGELRMISQALNNLAHAQLGIGRLEEALARADESLALLRENVADPYLVISLQTRAEVLAELGRVDEALRDSTRAGELAGTQGNQWIGAYCAEFMGRLHRDSGRTDEARIQWQLALELTQRQGKSTERLEELLAGL
ncbi:AfsR/SARP family transcriptional regulator [Streptacidiphilus fuscans]|uniref:Tetratricopeptide repeat protein n=1 Tax=Streptacidiphilus fuscans TaxID=2789292 RepID=A0A931B7D1_9ACTN|nr:BTAD domain-containing putative transcriptional regulator [Streptacidiphilus fuscans]MBF9072565.1 tetratricopeptide repeat protein [Streptacidiphilus fuscans]